MSNASTGAGCAIKRLRDAFELHRSGGEPNVVLLRQDKAGLVPWEAIRAKLALPADVAGRGVEPVVLDVVVCPKL